MDTAEKDIINLISEVLEDLLHGKKPEFIENNTNLYPLNILTDKVNELISSFYDIWSFIIPLSQGKLNIEPPKGNNVIVFPFKELYSQLKNLVWQVQQVADGDYNQRVYFMGEFAEAFNKMVDSLNEKDKQIKKSIKFLEDKYNVLLENARDIILFANLDGKLIEANKSAVEAYGYTKEELLSLNIFNLRKIQYKNQSERYLRNIMQGGSTFETVHVRKDGTTFPVEVSTQVINIGNQKISGNVIRDITDRKKLEDSIRYYENYDPLTSIPNRKNLDSTFNDFFNYDENHVNGALLVIDVDNLQFINDTFDHSVGDMVLINLVSVLKENLYNNSFLTRLGGDEFAILLRDVSLEDACSIAEKLRQEIEILSFCPINYKNTLSYTISIGVVPINEKNLKLRDLIILANNALFQAKDQGRNCVCIGTEEIVDNKNSEINNMLNIIKGVIKSENLSLYYQPVVNVNTGEIMHYEALLRIEKNNEIIHPGKVIPIAERFGLMSQIDKIVLKHSFKTLEEYPNLNLFVNLSGTSVGDNEILNYIIDNLNTRGINPSRLGIEITETMAVKGLTSADRWIRKLKEVGCRFALDDFGVGFSTFSYLQYLSVDYVKIDGSYVRDIDKNNKNRALVQAINTVAVSLGKQVIAEFVENSKIMDVLKEDKIGLAQGYYLGKPEEIPK